jgi:outer membrane receptor for ferrienterochelin and colicin
MDAESLAQFLKNTPAENIQKIEVITVPGSEYQVESSDGIINIVLKKKMSDGLNGNMRMSNTTTNTMQARQASRPITEKINWE